MLGSYSSLQAMESQGQRPGQHAIAGYRLVPRTPGYDTDVFLYVRQPFPGPLYCDCLWDCLPIRLSPVPPSTARAMQRAGENE